MRWDVRVNKSKISLDYCDIITAGLALSRIKNEYKQGITATAKGCSISPPLPNHRAIDKNSVFPLAKELTIEYYFALTE